ncbi:MAG: AI-2E family transporter, partial [Clostridia bacterium]|nr:AI-2E family transporter [Clostridia bacterium]
ARLESWLGGVLPGVGAGREGLRQQVNEMLRQMLGGLLSSVSAALPAVAARLLEALPSAVLVSMVTVIAGFYFCMDDGSVTRGLAQCLPRELRQRLPAWRQRLRQISLRYVRAYLLLLLITFAVLFFGFCLLGVEYAFLLAAVTALVDLLPAFGVGTVLIPWAILALLQKEPFLGGGLLILYGVLLVLRQMIEPKLVGKSLGLHPLLTLFASYAGWRLLGFLGMLLGPVLALLLKSVAAAWRKREGEGT